MISISMSKALGSGYNRFFHSKNFYRVVKGSRGSKKSKNTALCFIHDILKYPWANLLVVRRYSNTNKQSTYTDLKWAANRLKVKHLFKFNESLPEITVKKTGQKILFRGLDDPLKITSISVDEGILCWVWIEEAYQIENSNKFDTLIESIRGSVCDENFYKQITLTFNPWSERHWLKCEFFDEETKRKDVFSDTTTFRCNEWLDEQDRNRYLDLYRTNPRRAKVVCDGDWGITEGLVFDNWDVVDFDIRSKIKEVGRTAAGMDFGYTNDPTTFPISAVDLENKELWVYGELYEYAMLTKEIFERIKEADMLDSLIIADCAENRLIAELRMMGANKIRPSIKGPRTVNQGIQFMKGFKIHIHPSCERTIEEFSSYCYQRDKEGNWINDPVDLNNHIIDAIRYSLEPYHLGIKQPISKNKMKKIKKIFG